MDPKASRHTGTIVQIKTKNDDFEKWWGQANQRARFVNLRKLFPNMPGRTAYTELKLSSTDLHWVKLTVKLGNVTAVWYDGQQIYNGSNRRSTPELRKGLMIPIKPQADKILMRIDAGKDEPVDWGYTYRLEYMENFAGEITEKKTNKVVLSLTNNLGGSTLENLRLKAHCWTPGWTVTPTSESFDLADRKTMTFTVRASAAAGDWTGLTLTVNDEDEVQILRPTLTLPDIHVVQVDNYGDGLVSSAKIGGRECYATDQINNQTFIYYEVKDEVMENIKAEVKLSVEYYSLGRADRELTVYYDSHDKQLNLNGAYKTLKAPMSAEPGWHTHLFTLNDARFSNRQNAGADFRLTSNDELYVRRVQVEKLK